MAVCKACSTRILVDEVACDGICGHIFHASCLERASGGPFTCGECSDIRPCHVLRLMKGIAATLSTDQSFIADKVNSISANWAGLQILSDDFSSLNSKIDRLLQVTEVFGENLASLSGKTHELSSKFGLMVSSLDDLRMALTTSDLPSHPHSQSAESILPIIDDIRRSVRHVKGDLGSCSSAIKKNCELIGSVASDIRSMASRDALGTVPPLPAGGVAAAGSDASTPLAEPSPGLCCSTSTALSQDSILQQPPKQSEGRRLRRRKGRASPSSFVVNSDPDNSHPVVVQRTSGVDVIVQRATEVEGPGVLHSVSAQPAPDIGAAIGPVELDSSTLAGDASGAMTLRPAVPPRSIFISRIHPDTTVDDVVRHISLRLGVSLDGVNCRRIDRSRGGAGSFFASFRIVIPDAIFNSIISPEIWPGGVIVREFISRNHSGSKVTPKNSSARLRSTTLM